MLEKFSCAQNVRIGSTAQLLLSGATWKKFTISNYHRIEHLSALQWRLNFFVYVFDLIYSLTVKFRLLIVTLKSWKARKKEWCQTGKASWNGTGKTGFTGYNIATSSVTARSSNNKTDERKIWKWFFGQWWRRW